jgi:hypothetical protein
MEPYQPKFLTEDERGEPETIPSADVTPSQRELRPVEGSYMTYDAAIDDLRMMGAYKFALKSKLGEKCHVLQFKSNYSLDSVPNAYKGKDGPLLWKITLPGVVGYTTDQDFKTMYFKSPAHVEKFLAAMRGDDEGRSFEEVQEQGDNLKKVLW